jgi:hypothetical protein
MAWVPDEQAVTTAWFGPFKPWLIEIWPEARLIREPGMKNGLMRRGPFSCMRMVVSSMLGKPPMPAPTSTPVRYCWSGVLIS